MIKYKIKLVAFECDEEKGTATVIVDGEPKISFKNAIEGWNYFTGLAFFPLERDLRNKLQENGFNRWTGTRKLDYTESELKMIDAADEAARKRELYKF